jgi:Tol biopolymer transport system component
MNKRATLALLLSVGIVTPAWAQDECDPSNPLKSVIAVYSNRHDTVSTQFLTWDIYLMDPEDLDEHGYMSVWRHLPGPGGDWAPAVSPDGKGRIVFDSNRNREAGQPFNTSQLFLMKARADDPEQRLLTRGSSATWSPDGKSIAFHASASGAGLPINGNPGAATSDSAIFVAKVGDLLEGEPAEQITHPEGGQVDDDADWSAVGEKIAFLRKKGVDTDSAEIYVINADGTGLTRLTTNTEEERSPAWSPDGQRIAFSCRTGTQALEICIMNADGTGVVKVTNNTVADLSPHWSADGTKIVFQRPVTNPLPGQGQQTWIMDADGSVQEGKQLTAPPGTHSFPAWGEIKCAGQHDEDD